MCKIIVMANQKVRCKDQQHPESGLLPGGPGQKGIGGGLRPPNQPDDQLWRGASRFAGDGGQPNDEISHG